MNTLLRLIFWFDTLLLVLSIGMLVYHLSHTENMELGVFIIIPIDAILLLFYTILAISTYRKINYHIDYPNEVKVSTVYVLGILSLLLPIAFCLNEMKML